MKKAILLFLVMITASPAFCQTKLKGVTGEKDDFTGIITYMASLDKYFGYVDGMHLYFTDNGSNIMLYAWFVYNTKNWIDFHTIKISLGGSIRKIEFSPNNKLEEFTESEYPCMEYVRLPIDNDDLYAIIEQMSDAETESIVIRFSGDKFYTDASLSKTQRKRNMKVLQAYKKLLSMK